MNILLVEDDPDKVVSITEVIARCCEGGACAVTTVGTVNDALYELGRTRFEVIIADLVLPQMKGALEPSDATSQWCEQIEHHWSGKLSSWIVMTSFAEIAVEARHSFARHGVAVIECDVGGDWKKVLAHRLRDMSVDRPMDFVIICALEKERAALKRCADVTMGNLVTVQGLDCQEVTLATFRGMAVVTSATGLISGAIATAKAAELFKPRAIAMCGICGGIAGEVELGDLVVPDISWNYQAGKIADGKLKPELLQVPIPPTLRTRLKQSMNAELSRDLRDDLMTPNLLHREIVMVPMVSGSQVVADPRVSQEIAGQSRKVGALDMEVASVYAAARDFYNGGGIFFAAKTVVDLADEEKDDRLHPYGCILSARFVIRTIHKELTALIDRETAA